jgi:ParB family chromosome partitioning protein
MASQKGLGKGLGALLGELSMQEPGPSTGTILLPLQKVEPNPGQPRKNFDPDDLQQLADSIRMHGLIQPLTVRKLPNGFYQIIAGERRWRAARLAGLGEVPVVVLEADDKTAMELALVENLQRSDLSPIEEAEGYQRLMGEYGMTQEVAAERVGKSRPAVANSLRLLSLSAEVRDLVASGRLSAGHARALLALKNPAEQLAVAQKVLNLQLSVRQTEAMCKNLTKPPKKKPPETIRVDYIEECRKDLSKRLGRGVKIVNGRKKGRVELEYYGEDDLQRLYEALQALPKKEPKP